MIHCHGVTEGRHVPVLPSGFVPLRWPPHVPAVPAHPRPCPCPAPAPPAWLVHNHCALLSLPGAGLHRSCLGPPCSVWTPACGPRFPCRHSPPFPRVRPAPLLLVAMAQPSHPALSIPPTVGCAPCAPHGTPWTVLLAQLNARCPQGVCRAPWVSRKRIVKRGDAGAFEMCPCYVTFQGLHLAQGMSPLRCWFLEIRELALQLRESTVSPTCA